MTAFIESGDLEMDDGERFMLIRRIIPDFAFSGTTGDASIDMTIKGKDFPLQDASTLSSSTVTSSTLQNHIRVRSRSPIVRLESTGAGYGWRLGNLRFDIRTDGKR